MSINKSILKQKNVCLQKGAKKQMMKQLIKKNAKGIKIAIAVICVMIGCILSSGIPFTRAAEPPLVINKDDGGNTSAAGAKYRFYYELRRKSYDPIKGTAVYTLSQYFTISNGSIPVYSDKAYLTNKNGTNVYIGEFKSHNGNNVSSGTYHRTEKYDIKLVEGNNTIIIRGQFSGNDSGDARFSIKIDKFGHEPAVHGTNGTWVSGEVSSGKRTNESLFTDGAAGSASGNKTQTSTGFSYTDADEQKTATYRYSGTTLGNNAVIKSIKKNGATVSFSALDKPGTYVITSCTTDSADNEACGTRNIVVKSKYQVKYNGNTATSGSMSNSSHVYDTAKQLTTNAYVKTGYHFDHWNTKGDDSGASYTNQQSVKNLTSTDDGIVNLYAQWEANTYTVKYYGNNATGGTMVDTSHTYDTPKALRKNAFVRNGWRFISWNTKADGSGTSYTDQKSVKNLTSTNNGVVNLFAQWNKAPEITTVNKSYYENEISYEEWVSTYRMKSVTATDKEDGSLTDDIKVISDDVNVTQAGTYHVTYEVTDSVDQSVQKSATITIKYNNPPEIHANDRVFYQDELSDEEWQQIRMSNVSADDIEDGDLSANIEIIKDDVLPYLPGIYPVEYSVTDRFGKITMKHTNVTIIYNHPPTIQAENQLYYLGDITQNEWENQLRHPIATANDNEDGNITDSIQIILDDTDVSVPGIYHVMYEVTDRYGKKGEKQITVEIRYNQIPQITADNITIYENEISSAILTERLKQNASAQDAEDGDLSDQIRIIANNTNTKKPGNYEVTYEVIDSKGAAGIKTIDVTVLENREPILQLFTSNKRFIEGQYTQSEWEAKLRMKGVSAYDKEDQDLTDQIQIISDTTNPQKRGSYEVTYRVTDRFGKSAEKTAKVTVEPNEAPIIYANDKYFTTNDRITEQQLLKNVYASDDHDIDINKRITIKTNNIENGKAGSYEVTYEVIDSLGKKGEKTIMVHIKEAQEAPITPPIPEDMEVLYWWNGKRQGVVNITKLMEHSDFGHDKDALKDVVFGIFAKEDITYQNRVVLQVGSLIAITKADNDGQLRATIHHKGKYVLKELSTNDNYILDEKEYEFEY